MDITLSPDQTAAFARLLNRGINTWDQAPEFIKEFVYEVTKVPLVPQFTDKRAVKTAINAEAGTRRCTHNTLNRPMTDSNRLGCYRICFDCKAKLFFDTNMNYLGLEYHPDSGRVNEGRRRLDSKLVAATTTNTNPNTDPPSLDDIYCK